MCDVSSVFPSRLLSAVLQVEGQTLNLNSTAQVVHGVKLSKDQTGVTAELLASNVKVFFDGNTAHVSGTEPYILSGLSFRIKALLMRVRVH